MMRKQRLETWLYLVVLSVCGAGCGASDDGDTQKPDAGDTESDGGDTEPDAGDEQDAGVEPVPPWPGCPTADAYGGDASWPWFLEVQSDAVYCAEPEEANGIGAPNEALIQSRDQKAQLRFVPGTYPLPAVDAAQSELMLPMCYRAAPTQESLSPGSPGTLTTESYETYLMNSDTRQEYPKTVYSYVYEQAFSNDTDLLRSFQVTFEFADYDDNAPPTAVVTGRYVTNYLSEAEPTFLRIFDKTDNIWKRFSPCLFFDRETTENWTHVTWNGGEIFLDIDINSDLPETDGTEPSAFIRALGTLDGESFDQTDYWKLIYAPEHHHFVRHFAVIFDTPINGACGLKVLGIDPYITDTVEGISVFTIDCDMSNLEEKIPLGIEK